MPFFDTACLLAALKLYKYPTASVGTTKPKQHNSETRSPDFRAVMAIDA